MQHLSTPGSQQAMQAYGSFIGNLRLLDPDFDLMDSDADPANGRGYEDELREYHEDLDAIDL